MIVKILKDPSGTSVRLTDERAEHILKHPELAGLADVLESAIQSPASIIRSRTDAKVRLFYKRTEGTMFGTKWLCVVVKYDVQDAYVLTAYLTDKIKKGEVLWSE